MERVFWCKVYDVMILWDWYFIIYINGYCFYMIFFLDLNKINVCFEKDFEVVFKKILLKGYFILGNEVMGFENKFVKYCGVKFCIGVGNGLDVLWIILEGYKILGKLKESDEVLVVLNIFIVIILVIK